MILTLGTTPAVARAMVFEQLKLDSVNRAARVHVSAAGKAVNVGRVARMMGHDVLCTGLVGGDTGRAVLLDLESHDVLHQFIETSSPTRVCVTVIDRSAGHATELVEESGPADAHDEQKLIDLVGELAARCNVLVCSGTLAPGISPMLYYNAASVARSVNPKIRVIVDARGAPLHNALPAGVIVKCNAAELGDRTIRQTIGDGAEAVIVTDGANPTRVSDGESEWTIDSPKVEVVSPIGSGDAMAAGVACGLERGWPIEESAQLGVACAADNARHAIAGFVERAAVEQLLATINLNRQ